MTPMWACGVMCFLAVGTAAAAAPVCAGDACEPAGSQSLLQKTSKISGTVDANDDLEIHDAVLTTNLLAVDALVMRAALTSLSKEAHTKGQTIAVKHITDAMVLFETSNTSQSNTSQSNTSTDGGTKALADRVKELIDKVEPYIDAMQGELDSDYKTAKDDLDTLLDVINSTERTVLATEKAAVKFAASLWCTAWKTKEVAGSVCNGAEQDVANYNPEIAEDNAFIKKLGVITDCETDTPLIAGKCPTSTATVDSGALGAIFQNARDEYYSLHKTMKTKCGIKDDCIQDAANNGTAYRAKIDYIIEEHFGVCESKNTLHTTAVSSFNTNNQHRAAMYEALDKISCYVSHINESLDAAADINTCINALSTDYTAKFPDYATETPTCPNRALYATQIENYGGFTLNTLWEPSDGHCDAVQTVECPAGEYFTARSASLVATCTACATTHFKVGTNSDTVCSAKKTTCLAGAYFTASANSAADATCTPCSADTFKIGTTTDTSCETKTAECAAGLYFTASIGQTADSTCTACGASTFKLSTNSDTSCTPWQLCGVGEGLLTDGTPSTDIVCETCSNADKKYSQIDDRSACADHTQCGVGEGSTWSSLPDATKEQSTCTTCDATSFSGADVYGPCQIRTANCPAGEYFTPGSASSNAFCTGCATAYFKVGSNVLESCTPKVTQCPPNEYFTANSGQTANNTCTPCPDTEFKLGTNADTSCATQAGSATYRYWRFNALSKPAGNYNFWCMGEITFNGQEGSPLPKDGTATASQGNHGGHEPSRAFDSACAHFCSLEMPPGSLTYDFGQPQTVASYTIQVEPNDKTSNPDSWNIEASNDAQDWVTFDEQTGVQFSSTCEQRTYQLQASTL